jgi:hypothetical protein
MPRAHIRLPFGFVIDGTKAACFELLAWFLVNFQDNRNHIALRTGEMLQSHYSPM